MGSATWALWKRSPNSASAADAITLRKVRYLAWRVPFGFGLAGDLEGPVVASLRMK